MNIALKKPHKTKNLTGSNTALVRLISAMPSAASSIARICA